MGGPAESILASGESKARPLDSRSAFLLTRAAASRLVPGLPARLVDPFGQAWTLATRVKAFIAQAKK